MFQNRPKCKNVIVSLQVCNLIILFTLLSYNYKEPFDYISEGLLPVKSIVSISNIFFIYFLLIKINTKIYFIFFSLINLIINLLNLYINIYEHYIIIIGISTIIIYNLVCIFIYIIFIERNVSEC